MSKQTLDNTLTSLQKQLNEGLITYSEYVQQIALTASNEYESIIKNTIIDDTRSLLILLETGKISTTQFKQSMHKLLNN